MRKYISSLILGIIFAVFSLFVFIFNKVYEAAFYFGYFFALFALLLVVVNNILRVKFGNHVNNFVTFVPLTLSYFAVELIVSVIFIAIASIKTKVLVLIQIPLFALFLIVGLILYIGTNHIASNLKNDKVKVIQRDNLANMLEPVLYMTEDIKLKDRLEDLYQDVKFASPGSEAVVSRYDIELKEKISLLANSVKAKDIDSANMLITSIRNLLSARQKAIMEDNYHA